MSDSSHAVLLTVPSFDGTMLPMRLWRGNGTTCRQHGIAIAAKQAYQSLPHPPPGGNPASSPLLLWPILDYPLAPTWWLLRDRGCQPTLSWGVTCVSPVSGGLATAPLKGGISANPVGDPSSVPSWDDQSRFTYAPVSSVGQGEHFRAFLSF